jgi:hypothetical protein
VSRLKIYDLYPYAGTFSTQTAEYGGSVYKVAATSIRQAYALAHKRLWINPRDEHPVGIVSIYTRGMGIRLWCGCSGHNVTGGRVKHGDGIRALRAAISAHDDCEQLPRRRGPFAQLTRNH